MEHILFDTFYNYPLSLRRRISLRRKLRSGLEPRYWHLPLCVLSGIVLLAFLDVIYFNLQGSVPRFGEIWWAAIWIPGFVAAASSVWARGARLSNRFIMGLISGVVIAVFYAAMSELEGAFLVQEGSEALQVLPFLGEMAVKALWRAFLFSIVAIIGVFIAETRPVKSRVALNPD